VDHRLWSGFSPPSSVFAAQVEFFSGLALGRAETCPGICFLDASDVCAQQSLFLPNSSSHCEITARGVCISLNQDNSTHCAKGRAE